MPLSLVAATAPNWRLWRGALGCCGGGYESGYAQAAPKVKFGRSQNLDGHSPPPPPPPPAQMSTGRVTYKPAQFGFPQRAAGHSPRRRACGAAVGAVDSNPPRQSFGWNIACMKPQRQPVGLNGTQLQLAWGSRANGACVLRFCEFEQGKQSFGTAGAQGPQFRLGEGLK